MLYINLLIYVLTCEDISCLVSGVIDYRSGRASDFWPSLPRFNSRSGRYQAHRSTQPSIPPGHRVPAFTGWG